MQLSDCDSKMFRCQKQNLTTLMAPTLPHAKEIISFDSFNPVNFRHRLKDEYGSGPITLVGGTTNSARLDRPYQRTRTLKVMYMFD